MKDLESNNKEKASKDISLRDLLKALSGISVAGLFSFELFQKIDYDNTKRKHIIQKLGLDSIELPIPDYSKTKKQDIILIGIIEFGRCAEQLSAALGFIHSEEIQKRNKILNNWLQQKKLHVAITRICDVFDLHAERGLTIAINNIQMGRSSLIIKQDDNFQEMLEGREIGAIIISTFDHNYGHMAIYATKAGKHIYMEKFVSHTEEELNVLYRIVKESQITFQLGHQITQSIVFKHTKEIIDKNVLSKITFIEMTNNSNIAERAWTRYLASKGNLKPESEKHIEWIQWLGITPYVPFSIDCFYNRTKWCACDTGLIGQLFTHEFDVVNQLMRIGISHSVLSSWGIYYWKDNREIPNSLHCVFEYPNKDLTLLYSGNLASSRNRGRVFMRHDASMESIRNIKITVDKKSTQYKERIKSGLIDTDSPMLSFNPNSGQIDVVASSLEKYYTNRGLIDTVINGQQVDATHLHLREWLNCIRENKTPNTNIKVAYEVGITSLMAHHSYLEKRQVFWDKKII